MYIIKSVNKCCKEYGLSEYKGKVLRTNLGKPYIDYPLCVGVTHTDEVLIVGISQQNFGIDCESKNRHIKNIDRLVARFFCENEKKQVLSASDKQCAFLDIWVKKEAYVKFTGEGLAGLQKCDVTQLCGFSNIENDKNLIIYIYKDENNE